MESTTSSTSTATVQTPTPQEQKTSTETTNVSQTPAQPAATEQTKKSSEPELISKVSAKLEKLQKRKEKIPELELKEKNHQKLTQEDLNLLHSKGFMNRMITDLEEIKTSIHEHIEKVRYFLLSSTLHSISTKKKVTFF